MSHITVYCTTVSGILSTTLHNFSDANVEYHSLNIYKLLYINGKNNTKGEKSTHNSVVHNEKFIQYKL